MKKLTGSSEKGSREKLRALKELKDLVKNKNKISRKEYVAKLVDIIYINIVSQAQSGYTMMYFGDKLYQYVIEQFFYTVPANTEEGKPYRYCCHGIRAGNKDGCISFSNIFEVPQTNDWLDKERLVISLNGSSLFEQKHPETYQVFGEKGPNEYPYKSKPTGLGLDPKNIPVGDIIYDGNYENINDEGLQIMEGLAFYSVIVYDSFLDHEEMEELLSSAIRNINSRTKIEKVLKELK